MSEKQSEKTVETNGATTDKPITAYIEFPVSFNTYYGKIYDARNREVCTVKHLITPFEDRMAIGDFVADAINEAANRLPNNS